jgi:hypothetical protein
MKKLFLLFFLPIVCFGQEDIERYKVYKTSNIYTSILLDTSTGQTWQIQIGISDKSKRMKYVLSDTKQAYTSEEVEEKWNERIEERMKDWEEEYNSKPDSIVSAEMKLYWKPYTLKETIERERISQNGRFKLYPTENTYNFIMVDVIDGRTWQVQWNVNDDKRLCYRIW